MNGKKILAAIMISAFLLTGCGIKGTGAIIKINDSVITQKEYDKLMDKSFAQSPFAKMGMKDLKGNKDGFVYLMTEQRVINQLIIQELLNQEAKARGIKVTNKDVDAAVKKVMDKLGGRDQLTELLKQNNISVKEFKEDIKNQVRMQKLADASAKIEVSDAECKQFYDKNIDQFKHDDQVRASHILIAANPNEIQSELSSDPKKKYEPEELKAKVEKIMNEKKAEAEKLAKELQTDSSQFAAYAKKYSDDPTSAKQGGDLGFFAKNRMVPEFAKAAFDAKPNTVLDPVKTQFGYHIIIVTDRKAAGVIPYEKAQSDIRDFLINEKQIKALDDLTQAAKKKSKIEYLDNSYNPEEIDKKLKKQVDELTNGEAEKVRQESRKK